MHWKCPKCNSVINFQFQLEKLFDMFKEAMFETNECGGFKHIISCFYCGAYWNINLSNIIINQIKEDYMIEQKDFENKDGKWEFNENVAVEFEDMLSRSIPQYDIMRNLVFNLGCYALPSNIKNKTMLDIGCSDGLNLQPFVRKFGALVRYRGVDVSEPMLKKAAERYKGYIDANLMQLDNLDLRYDFPTDKYNLITSILTIQFIPIEYRQRIMFDIYNNLSENGMAIVVEKVLGNCHEINNVMVNEYYKLKHENGYSYDEIERKKISLEGVLVPMTSNWNIDLLKQAGFRKIDVFWRWMNFEGYVAIK